MTYHKYNAVDEKTGKSKGEVFHNPMTDEVVVRVDGYPKNKVFKTFGDTGEETDGLIVDGVVDVTSGHPEYFDDIKLDLFLQLSVMLELTDLSVEEDEL